jgi:hypothetical protein
MINNGVNNVYFYSIVSDDNGILLCRIRSGALQIYRQRESWSLISSMYAYHLMKDKDKRIYALTYGGGVYRTTDSRKETWERVDKNFNNGYIFGLAFDSSRKYVCRRKRGCGNIISQLMTVIAGQRFTREYQCGNT